MIHKSTKILIIETALAIIMLLLMTSCGTRKVSKSNTETKETSKTEIVTLDSSKTTTNTSENTKIVFDVESNEFTVTPIDTSKSSQFGKVIFKNVRLTHRNIKNNTILDKTINVAKIEQKAVKTSTKAESSKTAKQDIKVIDKKANYYWLFWLLLLIPAYFVWQKYKDKIWFI